MLKRLRRMTSKKMSFRRSCMRVKLLFLSMDPMGLRALDVIDTRPRLAGISFIIPPLS